MYFKSLLGNGTAIHTTHKVSWEMALLFTQPMLLHTHCKRPGKNIGKSKDILF